jgi:hypothetical protein
MVAFDWNNGKNVMAKAILPMSFEFWYRPGPVFDSGMLLSGDELSRLFRRRPKVSAK